MVDAEHGRPFRARLGFLSPERARRLVLPGLLLVVAGQVLINYHTWLFSGPAHLYYLRGLNEHPLPYIDARIEYPVLTGVFMTVAAGLTHGLTDFLRLNSVMLGACALGCTCVLWSISKRAAYAFALTPLLLVYSLHNWDLFTILLMLLGWRAYLRQRHATAGIWLALAVFAKFFPIILLGGCLLALVKRWHTTRDRNTCTDLTRFTAATAITSLVVNLPFAIPAFKNWMWFWTFNDQRPGHADLLSWLHILGTADTGTTNLVLITITAVAVIAGGVAIWRGAPVANTTALVFVAFMVMEKVYSPQYTIWVYAYALLADWDPWVLVAISIFGLVDDADARTHVMLVHSKNTQLLAWYLRNIQYREQGLRLLGLAVIGTAMLARDRSARRMMPTSDVTEMPRVIEARTAEPRPTREELLSKT